MSKALDMSIDNKSAFFLLSKASLQSSTKLINHCDSELEQIWQEKEFVLDLLFSSTQLKLLFFFPVALLFLRFASAENCSRSDWRKLCGHLAFTCGITKTHKCLKILFIVYSIKGKLETAENSLKLTFCLSLYIIRFIYSSVIFHQYVLKL